MYLVLLDCLDSFEVGCCWCMNQLQKMLGILLEVIEVTFVANLQRRIWRLHVR